MRYCLVVLSILSVFSGFAQNFSFISFSNSLGLPQSQVQCITQDDDGYLWVGTLGGLAKFNGKQFSTFPLEKGLYSNRISCLKYIQKSILVGHEGGITLIKNNTANSYTLSQNDRTITVTDFIEYQGKIIAATEGGGIYIIHNNRLAKVSLNNEDASVCRTLEIINNKLYIGTRDGLYQTSDLTNFTQVSSSKHHSISGIVQTNQSIYIATFYGGLFRTDASFETLDSIPINLPDLYIGSLEKDKKNQLWLTSPDGVVRLDQKNEPLILNKANGFPAKSINCSFEDREGNIWFGSDGRGLIRFANQNLELYTKSTGLASELILCGLKINQNKYIFGSYDAGAFVMDASGKCQNIPIPASTIWSIAYFEGKTWFATNEGLFSWDFKNAPKLYHFNEINNIFRVIKQVGNKLIVASENQIGSVQNNELKPYSKFKFSLSKDGKILDFTMYNSNLLVATSKGLYDINLGDNTQKLIRYFNSSVSSIEVDIHNRLWIGTQSGLILYDGITFKPISYSSKSGAKFINFIQRVDKKQLVGTNDGIYIFDLSNENPTLIKHIGTYNGLINLESNINSSMYENGNFWFGTTDGLAKMNLMNQFEDYPPKLKITRILVNLAEINEKDFFSNLKLTHSRNNLIIELDGIDMDDPESMMYQYLLEGETDKWSPPSPLSTIVLSNLNDGKYTLKIRAISGTKKFSKIQHFSFSITPPYWRTWWFYVICIVLVYLSLRYYFRLQIRRERERNYQVNLENKSRLLALEQQSLNASMNRHFIFNSLNSIQYFINTQDRISANRYLTNFAKLIRKNLDSAAEGDNVVTLQQELERLELYLSLEAMRFKDRFTYRIENKNIDTEHVKVPAMLLQPFVENSIIHGILPNESKKGEIVISIKSIGGQLEICIDDNGIGIDYSLAKKAAFKGDHKSQGMEITSKRIDLIRKMWNQNYELIGPFQMTNPDSSIKGTRVLIKIPYENLDINN